MLKTGRQLSSLQWISAEAINVCVIKLQQALGGYILTIFNKTEIPNNKFLMASGQGAIGLSSVQQCYHLCIVPLPDIYIICIIKHIHTTSINTII